MERASRSPARAVAAILGALWVASAAAEAAARDGLEPVLRYSAVQNAARWGVGAGLLVAAFGSRTFSRVALRVVGAAGAAVVVAGLLRPAELGRVLGYPGSIPLPALAVYGITAAIALVAGSMRSAERVGP